MFRFRKQSSRRFGELRIIGLIVCFKIDRWYWYRKLNVIITLGNELWSLLNSEELQKTFTYHTTGLCSQSEKQVWKSWCMRRWGSSSYSLFAIWWCNECVQDVHCEWSGNRRSCLSLNLASGHHCLHSTFPGRQCAPGSSCFSSSSLSAARLRPPATQNPTFCGDSFVKNFHSFGES